MKKALLRMFFILVAVIAVAGYVLLLYPYGEKQADGGAGKSWLLTIIENRLSTPGRQVRISNIDSLRSSHALIRSITVADRDGVWLKVSNVTLDWRRLAILRRDVSVDSLVAERIDIFRKPLADASAPKTDKAEKKDDRALFALPKLPVDIFAAKIAAKQIVLGDSLLGEAATFGLDGKLDWSSKILAADFNLPRLDGAGGGMTLDVQKPSVQDDLTFAWNVNAPANGLLVKAEGKTTADGFPRQMALDFSLHDPSGRQVVVPFTNGAVTLEKAAGHAVYGGDNRNNWDGAVSVTGLHSKALSWRNAAFTLGGPAENLDDPAKRHVGLKIQGKIEMLSASALPSSAPLRNTQLTMDMDWRADAPLTLRTAQVKADGLLLDIAGTVEDRTFKGKTRLVIADLKRFGFAAAASTGSGDAVVFQADGFISPERADMTLRGQLADMALFDPRVKGGAVLTGSAHGQDGQITLALRGEIGNAVWNGRPLTQTVVTLDGVADNRNAFADSLRATIKGTGRFDGQPLELTANLLKEEQQLAVEDFSARIGAATVTGHGKRQDTGALEGSVQFDVPDLSTPAALFFQQGKGMAQGTVSLAGDRRAQNASIKAHLKDVEIAGIRVGKLDVQALVQDMFGVPRADGALDAADVSVLGYKVQTVTAKSVMKEQSSQFNAAAALADHTVFSASGTLVADSNALSAQMPGWQLLLDAADVRRDGIGATLKRPTKIVMNNKGAIAIDDLALALADGTLTVSGTVADSINLAIDARALPLSVANIVRPDLAAGGVVTGKVRISGPRSRPAIDADVTGSAITADWLRQYGLTPLDVRVQTKTAGEVLTLDAHAGGSGIDAAAKGQVFLKTQKLDLDIALRDTPLALLNNFVRGQDLSGVVSGSAHLSGMFSDPSVTFTVDGRTLTAKVLSESGVQPLTLKAAGGYAKRSVNLESFALTSASGITLQASGQMPLGAAGVALKINGSAPLGLANYFLAGRGAQLSGTLMVNADVKGSLKAPLLHGGFSVNNGQFSDPQSNLRLNAINLRGTLDGDKVVLEQMQARSASGGALYLNGSVSTNIAQGLPADLMLKLDHAAYNDGSMVAATLSGALTVKGALLREPLIGGKVQIEKAEINVPDTFGGASLVDIQHKHLTPPIAQTLRRAGIDEVKTDKKAAAAQNSGPKIDVWISAPGRIFIRGRGLDAEMGGNLHLVGYVRNVLPIGSFNLIRGRFDILTKRLTFDSGSVRLAGQLNPELNFVAHTSGGDITVTVTVSGTPDNLDIAFTSQPELPQDEVLAQLVFGRSLSELSPFQVAQLAVAAAQLAGVGGSTSLLGNLRSATGLDDLDVVSDGAGNTAVKAGRYIRENIYLGVEAGSGGTTSGTVNMDINRNLKAKGIVGSESSSGVGIFYEKDY